MHSSIKHVPAWTKALGTHSEVAYLHSVHGHAGSCMRHRRQLLDIGVCWDMSGSRQKRRCRPCAGVSKLQLDEAKLSADLDSSWEVLAEPIQTVMRR